jgi:hypothetical protein
VRSVWLRRVRVHAPMWLCSKACQGRAGTIFGLGTGVRRPSADLGSRSTGGRGGPPSEARSAASRGERPGSKPWGPARAPRAGEDRGGAARCTAMPVWESVKPVSTPWPHGESSALGSTRAPPTRRTRRRRREWRRSPAPRRGPGCRGGRDRQGERHGALQSARARGRQDEGHGRRTVGHGAQGSRRSAASRSGVVISSCSNVRAHRPPHDPAPGPVRPPAKRLASCALPDRLARPPHDASPLTARRRLRASASACGGGRRGRRSRAGLCAGVRPRALALERHDVSLGVVEERHPDRLVAEVADVVRA